MNEFCTSVAIMERGRLVVSGRIDEVNARIMGDSVLAVEVLGEPEVFLSDRGRRRRAGPVERKNGTFEFRFRGDSDAASELLVELVQRAFGSPRSPAAKRTWKSCSSRSGRGSCRDAQGLDGRLARQSDLHQALPFATAPAAARLGHRRHPGALHLHRLGGI